MTTFASILPAIVVALRAGEVVVLPADSLYAAPHHQLGPIAGMQRHLQVHAAGGPVSVVQLPLVERIAVFAPQAVDHTGHDSLALLNELERINALLRGAGSAQDLLDRIRPYGPIHVLAFEVRV